ncbi:MAG: galactokinase family protein [Myxococcota bacterium]
MTGEERLASAAANLRERCGLGAEPVRGVLSPYRICPIGAHSDHQHGPVLGTAVNAYTALAFVPTREPVFEVTSDGFEGLLRIDLTRDADGDGPLWTRYARGAAALLKERLPAEPIGLRARVEGTLPGGGLSSSASVVCAYLLALADVNGLLLAEEELVALARRVENEFAGIACGILDPASIVGSRRGHLLAIDTARSRWQPVPLGEGATDVRFLVTFTGIARNLESTGFNERVAECVEAAGALGRLAGRQEVELLGELSDEVIDVGLQALPENLARRARHFRTERARVLRGIECWREGDLETFGELMSASCESSINDYETGSPELVRLQEILLATPGVMGARFSGAGFGGCAIAMVRADAARDATDRVLATFRGVFPHLAERSRSFLVESDDGARVV